MIKGLIRRRFWWTIVEEYSEDCVFVWSQRKYNKIFKKQQQAVSNRMVLVEKTEGDDCRRKRRKCKKELKRLTI
jgi:hypothetical protein